MNIAYLSKRFAMLLLNLLFASFLTFLLLRLTPGDPAEIMVQKIFVGTIEYEASQAELEAVRNEFQLERPILLQYRDWLTNAIGGNLGFSYSSRRSVLSEILLRLPATLTLACCAMILSLILTTALAAVVRLTRSRAVRAAVESMIIFSIAMPNFYLALLLVLMFSVKLDWLPVSGYGGPVYYILPVTVLAFSLFGFSARILNASVDETLSREYIVTARAKGLSKGLILKRHLLRNSLIPVTPYISLQFAHILSGVVIIETLFSFPGLGKYLVESINNRDVPAIEGAVIFAALMFSLANFLGDVMLVLLDPRIRFQGSDS